MEHTHCHAYCRQESFTIFSLMGKFSFFTQTTYSRVSQWCRWKDEHSGEFYQNSFHLKQSVKHEGAPTLCDTSRSTRGCASHCQASPCLLSAKVQNDMQPSLSFPLYLSHPPPPLHSPTIQPPPLSPLYPSHNSTVWWWPGPSKQPTKKLTPPSQKDDSIFRILFYFCFWDRKHLSFCAKKSKKFQLLKNKVSGKESI